MPDIKNHPLYKRLHSRILAKIAAGFKVTDESEGYVPTRCASRYCSYRGRASDMVEIDDSLYCDDCAVDCDNCGHRMFRDDGYGVGDKLWCEGCVDNSSFVCYACDDRFPDSEARPVVVNRNGRMVSYCKRCYEDSTWFCEHCDESHPDNYTCRIDYDAIARRGNPTPRFIDRFMGLELETGEHGGDRDFIDAVTSTLKGWTDKEDGSLRNGGREFVSPPLSGDELEKDINQFYYLVRREGVEIDWNADNQIGAHMHVDARDIWKGVSMSKPDTVDALISWGRCAPRVVKYFVSRRRAENLYCSGGFGFRNPEDRENKSWSRSPGLPNSEGRYPTVAIRQDTVEFRIWPGTTSVTRYKARAELSLRMVQALADAVNGPDADTRRSGWAVIKAMQKLETYGMDQENFNNLMDLLGVSMATREALAIIHNRFYNNTITVANENANDLSLAAAQ